MDHYPLYNKRDDIDNLARYLTFGCYGHKHLFDDSALCKIFVNQLDSIRTKYDWELWAYVIMPNHIHMVVFPKDKSQIRKQLAVLKRQTSYQIIEYLKKNNPYRLNELQDRNDSHSRYRVWQYGGGYDRNLWTPKEIRKTINYIHNNPARVGLCESIVEYKWSSAKAWLEGIPDPIAINAESYLI